MSSSQSHPLPLGPGACLHPDPGAKVLPLLTGTVCSCVSILVLQAQLFIPPPAGRLPSPGRWLARLATLQRLRGGGAATPSFPPSFSVRPSVRLSVRPRSGPQHGRRELQWPPPGAAGGVRRGDSGGERGRLVSPPPPPLSPFVPAPPPPRLCFHPAPPPRSREGGGDPEMLQRPGRAREELPLCAPGEGPGRAGPGGAPAVPEHPEAAPAARWERWWLDAGWRDAGSRCVAWGFLALQNCSSTPSSSPWAPAGDRCAPGGQGHLRHLRAGGDRTGRARAVYPAQPSRPPHKGKARAGEERSGAGWGPGRPAHRGASWSWGVTEGRSLPHGHRRQVPPVPLGGRGGRAVRKEARHMQRRDRASGVPLEILEHLPPSPEPAYVTM